MFSEIKNTLHSSFSKVSTSKQIIFTGHSFGGGLSTMAAFYFRRNSYRTYILTFGQPLAGDACFEYNVQKYLGWNT